MQPMRVLVACEFSNRVRDAFLTRGHDAWSCDLRRADHPSRDYRRHLRCDVGPLLRESWDLVIAHPPCTYLCNSGVWLIHRQEDRLEGVAYGAAFFLECLGANAPKVCVENPVMHKYAKAYIPWQPTQIIKPYQFGERGTKKTCLWLRGLPPLVPTEMVDKQYRIETTCQKLGSSDSDKRSITFQGIANAMAAQWG